MIGNHLVDTIIHSRLQRFTAQREGARPLDVTLNLPGMHNIANALAAIAVGTELGVPRTNDFNGPDQTGGGYYQYFTRDGRRCSAAVACR